MAFLYLTEQGAILRKSGERLFVEKDEATLLEIPAAKVEGVLVFGNVYLTTPALQLLLNQGVELALFTRRGRLLGQLTSPFPKNLDLRRAQYGRAGDPAFCLDLARAIVAGKLANSLALVREFSYNHPETDLQSESERLSALLPQVEEASTLSSLLGLEGSGARFYYQAFARMVRRAFNFTGRRRRPAPDPVNALLSLGYTMVYNEIASLLDGLGFDPYLGFYHQPDYGHATLASDLLEEFRAPLVDRLTLTLINNRVFTQEDFFLHEPSGSVYLQDEPRKRYFQEYERFVNRSFETGDDGQETDFRRLFRRQAERLRNALLGGERYQPFKFSWR
jgi:CRISPR-associated protein Cas1